MARDLSEGIELTHHASSVKAPEAAVTGSDWHAYRESVYSELKAWEHARADSEADSYRIRVR